MSLLFRVLLFVKGFSFGSNSENSEKSVARGVYCPAGSVINDSMQRATMAGKKERQAAVDYYRNLSGDFDWNALMDYTSGVLEARDAVEDAQSAPDFNEETARSAIASGSAYLKLSPQPIDSASFRKHCSDILEDFISRGIVHDEQIEAMRHIEWDKLRDEVCALAGSDPNEFFIEAVPQLLGEKRSELAEVVLAGLLINVVRAYLGGCGTSMSGYLSSQNREEVPANSFKCPTCGQPASLSQIIDASEDCGHERRLFCACCGTAWPYERRRCGLCGQTDTDKLQYLCADEDKLHRLHVCEACGGVLPTVFQDAMNHPFDADIEQSACGLIQSLWLEETGGTEENAE